MSDPIPIEQRDSGTVEPLVLAVREAMEMLENMAIGGIGDGGPTIDELDEHVEKTGQSYDNDSDYHTAQWTWRKLQQGLNSQNPTGLLRQAATEKTT